MALSVRPHEAARLKVDRETVRPAEFPDDKSFAIPAVSIGTIYTWLVSPVRPEDPPGRCVATLSNPTRNLEHLKTIPPIRTIG